MKIALGSDHAGFELKQKVRTYLEQEGRDVNDLGTTSTESVDYPDFAVRVAHEVVAGHADYGVLVCGSGIGMAISANKVAGIRAANVTTANEAQLMREHNDANVLAIGARILDESTALKIVDTFLSAQFARGRHEQRVKKIAEIEKQEIATRKAEPQE